MASESGGGGSRSDGSGGALAGSGGSPLTPPSAGGTLIGSGGASGGSLASAGGTVAAAGGAITAIGGAASSTGGAMHGSGGAFEVEESFSFLGNAWESSAFATHLFTLSQYLPGEEPYHFYFFPPDVTFYSANAPQSIGSDFLLGYSTWVVGENQFLRSFNPQDGEEIEHGRWGVSPGGYLESRVDGAAKLNDEVLVVAVWDDVLDQGQLWIVNDPSALSTAQERLKDDAGQLVYESPGLPLSFHGITSQNQALFSDGHNVLEVDDDGQLSVFAGPDEAFVAAEGPLFADALLTIGNTGGVNRMRIFAGHWWEGNIDPELVPETLTWWDETTVFYQSANGMYQWDPYLEIGDTFREPRLISTEVSTVPRGQAVQWGNGVALRAHSMNGWTVAFIEDNSTTTCTHPTASIGRLKPHVLNGVSGALFDEIDPTDNTRFGRIYFCAPGQDPVDLLSEHELFGRLLPH